MPADGNNCCSQSTLAVNLAPTIPCFFICHALYLFEDGWAAFEFMASCRRALFDCDSIARRLRCSRRSLLRMMAFLRSYHLNMPGFDPMNGLELAMQRLRLWDPPAHIALLIEPPSFMQDTFRFGSQGNMRAWIQNYPEYQNQESPSSQEPLEVLRRMNPSLEGNPLFQRFLQMLREGQARFFYSPMVYNRRQPMQDQLPPGPGLMIAFRYRSHPMAICCRFTTDYYIETSVVPWLIYHNIQDEIA